MIKKNGIHHTISLLDFKYRKARKNHEALLYSKLALIELCGWVEETIDDMVLNVAKKRIKNATIIKHVEDSIIRENYGFNYNKHFRAMLSSVIGLITFNKVESKINPANLQIFVSVLNNLYKCRCDEAHKQVNTTRRIDAPSMILVNFNRLHQGLIDFEKALNKIV